jgi:hypothetical protein
MQQYIYIITFDDTSGAEANHYASELKDILLDVSPDVSVEQRRDTTLTQDLGTTLVLLLGTSSMAAIAKALGNWLQLRRSAQVTVKTEQGEIIGKNLTSKDALKLAELLLPKK